MSLSRPADAHPNLKIHKVHMIFIHSVVNNDSCCWAVTLGWLTFWSSVSNLIVLYTLFLTAKFASNTRWEIQKFHHNNNSSGIYPGRFSKSFGWELTTFPGYLNKTTLP